MRLGDRRSRIRRNTGGAGGRLARNTAIAILILVLLLGVGAVAYVWYMGKYHPAKSITTKLTPGVAPTIRKPKISPNTKESVSQQNFTTPVAQGSNASITIKTLPESNCVITLTYDDKPSKDSGLAPKKADEYGSLTWTWTVEETVPVGKHPLKIICEWNKKTALLLRDLEVKKPEDLQSAQ